MPKVSFYLRNEDVDKWKSIEKKTQWAHDQLNPAKVKAEIYGVDVNTPKGRQMLKDYRTEQVQVFNVCKKHGLPVQSGRTICGIKDCK